MKLRLIRIRYNITHRDQLRRERAAGPEQNHAIDDQAVEENFPVQIILQKSHYLPGSNTHSTLFLTILER